MKSACFKWKAWLFQYFWITLIGILFLLSFFKNPSVSGLYIYLRQICILSFAVTGAAIVFLVGEIHLAAGGQIACVIVLFHWLMADRGFSAGVSCLLLAAASAVFGWGYGFLNDRLHIKAIYFTFALQTVFNSLAVIGPLNFHPGKTTIRSADFTIWTGTMLGIPRWIVFWILVFGLLWCFLRYTRIGRSFPILGSASREDMERMETHTIKRAAFVLSSLLITLTAVLFYMRTGTNSKIDGDSYSFNTLVALCLGGLGGKKGQWILLCSLAGSAGVVMLHILWQRWGPPLPEMMIDGVIILYGLIFIQKKGDI
ncbi:hypothetical protein FACS1894130_02280 [Spirochaetia bacterium]|nr:hypothetical protein FACS1894130_02280 [Spirochaetia bacterium]